MFLLPADESGPWWILLGTTHRMPHLTTTPLYSYNTKLYACIYFNSTELGGNVRRVMLCLVRWRIRILSRGNGHCCSLLVVAKYDQALRTVSNRQSMASITASFWVLCLSFLRMKRRIFDNSRSAFQKSPRSK